MRTTAIQPTGSIVTIIYPKALREYSQQINVAARVLQKDIPAKEDLVYRLNKHLGQITMSIRRRGFLSAFKDFFGENPNIRLIEQDYSEHGVSPSLIIDGKRLYSDMTMQEQISQLP